MAGSVLGELYNKLFTDNSPVAQPMVDPEVAATLAKAGYNKVASTPKVNEKAMLDAAMAERLLNNGLRDVYRSVSGKQVDPRLLQGLAKPAY